MRTSFATMSLLGLAAAAPSIQKRDVVADRKVAQFALTLEHLEANFYAQGLTKFDAAAFKAAGYPAWVRERMTEIALHESKHVGVLETVLKAGGETPTASCTYAFNSPLSSVEKFLQTAMLFEGVGTAAYGAATSILTTASYRRLATGILGTETRQSAWLKADVFKGDAFPYIAEVPLETNQAWTLASGSIVSCPKSNPDLGVKAFPAIDFISATDSTGKTSKPSDGLCSGDLLTLHTDAKAPAGKQLYVTFMDVLNPVSIPYVPGKAVTIPANFFGTVYVIITDDTEVIGDANTVAGPIPLELPLQNRAFPIQKVL